MQMHDFTFKKDPPTAIETFTKRKVRGRCMYHTICNF